MATVEITKEKFDELAQVAAKDNCLRVRKTQYGMEAGIFINGHLMVKATPNKDGGYDCVMFM